MRRYVLFAVLLLAVAGAALFRFAPEGSSAPPAPSRAPPVAVAEVVARPMPLLASTIGRVQPIASVQVRSRIDGVIAGVDVADGQQVKAGDVLFRLDDRALTATLHLAEANLARDRAQLEHAQREVARLTPLSQRDYVSRQQYDQTRTNATAAEAAVQADQAQVETARVLLSYATIRAPIAGRLGSLAFKVGSSIKANDTTPLVTLNQLHPIYVAFSLPQVHFAAVRRAMQAGPLGATARVPGDPAPPAQGTLSFIENAIDAASNTLSLKAQYANADNRLWPGQFVDVTLTLGTQANAVVVPAAAVQAGQGGSYVFVLAAESKVEVRHIVLDRTLGEQSVVAEGLAPGEKVVTEGQLRLDDGMRVAVRPAGGA